MMNISPARTAAFDILLRVERDRAFTSVLLPQYEETLSGRDRSLCHAIVLGTLRKQVSIDREIAELSRGKKLDVEVRIALRMGVFQLHHLDRVPAHSVVNDSVFLVQRAKKSSAKGFVNAILRKAGTPSTPAFVNTLDKLESETSHPRWLLERWIAQFGEERAAAIAAANNAESRLSFRQTRKGIELGATVPVEAERSSIATSAFVARSMTLDLRAAVEAGEVYFQDEASQAVAELVTLAEGERLLDVCAAPGGKTSLIASRNSQSAMIVAGDIHHARVKLIDAICRRQGVNEARVVNYDAAVALPFADDSFDSVLVDAPCSGTGTIRSNPELRYFLSSADIAAFQSKQLAILRIASKVVRPGGTLVYSTCSLETEENEEVIASFLAEHGLFKLVGDDLPDSLKTAGGFLRTYPDRDGTDGFFAAVMRRDKLDV